MALTKEQLARALELTRELKRRRMWSPLPGPQSDALQSEADITGFGGAAGGGKTDLACGLALTKHEKTMILRENGTELTGVIDRLTELLGGRDGYNGQDKIWRTTTPDGKPRQIEFGSYPNPGDEAKYQGRPHDLLVYDEAANHRESAVRFLMGWLRTTTPGQRCRALLTFNPPTTAEGRWIIDFFGPWLNKKHPNPAKPGELRWFATIAGKDIEVPDNRPFILKGDKRVYLFDPEQHRPEEIVKPMSRTFIPSRVSNNPYLMGTGYVTTLQALPEPLRSQMLNGDFNAGIQDDPWQVIPTAWVEAAMARWQPKLPKPPMDSMGVDVARGGKDNTVLSPRHGNWYDELITYPGSATPNGPQTAGLVIAATRDSAPIHIDVIGVGSSPYDFLREANQQVIGVNVAEGATATDKSGRLRFFNLRSQLWWQMREALDPSSNTGIALPNDPRLLADLTAPKWCLRGSIVQVESRDEIVKRIGRSPDYASAVILAQMDTPKLAEVKRAMELTRKEVRGEYDPYGTMR